MINNDKNEIEPKNHIQKVLFLLLTVVRHFFLVSILWVLIYKFIPPPATYLMFYRYFEGDSNYNNRSIEKKWVSLDKISPNFAKAVMAAEDQKFFEHFGFDLEAIKKAWIKNEKAKRIKGGSTISQQTAKNVFLWPNRSWIRKGFEAYFTFLIEVFWSKNRILEIYINVAEMGKNIYGVEAASINYFGKPSLKLSKNECALIVACLPNPRKWNPKKPTRYILRRKNWILKNMAQPRYFYLKKKRK